jgi:hypothetical protein
MIFILFFTLGAQLLHGQTHKILSYKFNNTLNESKGIGPALTNLDSAGVFVVDTLNKVNNKTKTVYRFKKNWGFQFNNALAGNFLDSTYTIELYFKFDDVDGWNRVIDWKNRTTDDGAYVYYGDLGFYNFSRSDSTTVMAGDYTYFVVTRNGVTKNLWMYSDAKNEVNFIDAEDAGVIDTSHVLNFFRDDLIVQNEASSGTVALLNIYNYLLDSATVKHNFDSLQGELFSIRESRSNNILIMVYPNPARDIITIETSEANFIGSLSIINCSGQQFITRQFTKPKMQIDISNLPSGVYFVRLTNDNTVAVGKIIKD